MSNRLIILIAGLVLAYLACYIGDGLYLARNDPAISESAQGGYMILTVVSCLPAIVMGTVAWFNGIDAILPAGERSFKHSYPSDDISASLAIVAFGYIFGAAAGPFANYGPYFWYWVESRWVFVLALAFVTYVLTWKALLQDASAEWRAQKAARQVAKQERNNVRDFGRRDNR